MSNDCRINFDVSSTEENPPVGENLSVSYSFIFTSTHTIRIGYQSFKHTESQGLFVIANYKAVVGRSIILFATLFCLLPKSGNTVL